MTGADLKRTQDHFLEGAKKILLEHGHLRPMGFIITLHTHVEKLAESGWGGEFIDPKPTSVPGVDDDHVAVLILDLLMDWKRLYHAVLNVFPQTQSTLPGLLAIGKDVGVDDPYMRVMRPFLEVTKLDEKDVIAATLRQVCAKVDAFACIMQSEAWLRIVGPSENVADVPDRLGQDKKSIEIALSSMETYDFARMLTLPIHRKAGSKKRDEGKILGFGDRTERLDTPDNTSVLKGRLVRFLKPLGVAS